MSDPNESEIDRFRSMVAPELLSGLDMLPSFEWTSEVLAQVRAIDFRELPAPELSAPQASVHREERFIPAAGGAPDIRVLIYRPADSPRAPQPAFFHVHGGGYITGAPEINDVYSRSFSCEQRCVVASVDYRLAPETRYPGSLEDCYAALEWLHRNADELSVDRYPHRDRRRKLRGWTCGSACNSRPRSGRGTPMFSAARLADAR